jgi:very-short-patch-repair endonuclease
VFRRQVVIAGYTPSGIAKRVIVDFAATKARLIVEVDGGWHAGRERADARRDRALERAGWRVVRVAAEGVRAKPEGAVERIKAALAAAKAGAP